MRIGCLANCLVVAMLGLGAVTTAAAAELSGTASLMAYAHETKVTLNGTVLTPLSGGASQSIRLFNPDHPMRSQAPDNMAHMFSLKPGENVIEVIFEKTSEDNHDLELKIEISGFDKPHYQMTIHRVASGTVKRTFVVGEPGQSFETTVVDDASLQKGQ